MKNNILLNCLILVSLAFTGYAATIFFNKKTPTIIVQPEAPVETIEEPDTVADFTFTDMKGDEYSLQQFKGKIVLLNFWASWCPPCVKEFPHFIEVANAHPEDVVFIGLSSEKKKKTMIEFVQKIEKDWGDKLNAPNILIAHDKEEATHRIFRTYKLPETMIIDQNLELREKLIGADWTVEYLNKKIEELKSEQ